MGKRTALFEEHIKAQGKMVDFAGWEMPIHYGSQLEEHHAVRKDVGIFDVSHMAVLDILGPGARDFLRHLLANDVDKLQSRGKALYSCMLYDHGGVVDDLIVYFLDVQHYRLVLNASRAEADIAWMQTHGNGYSVGLHRRPDLSIIAVQGPKTLERLSTLDEPDLVDAIQTIQPFECVDMDSWFVARTGYTGEDGFEIMMENKNAPAFWQKLIAAGCKPCGLGARDTLRLEAGFNLYGSDMDETTSPLESNLAWTIAWEPTDRLFIGRTALELQKKAGVARQLVGLVLEDKGVLRSHQRVLLENGQEGMTTSGGFAPTLGLSIALARVPVTIGEHCKVDIRGKLLNARVVKPRFVSKGKILIK